MDAVDTPCYDTQCYLYFSDRLLSQYTFQVLGASGSHQARLGYICVYRTQVNLLLSDQLSQYTFQEVGVIASFASISPLSSYPEAICEDSLFLYRLRSICHYFAQAAPILQNSTTFCVELTNYWWSTHKFFVNTATKYFIFRTNGWRK